MVVLWNVERGREQGPLPCDQKCGVLDLVQALQQDHSHFGRSGKDVLNGLMCLESQESTPTSINFQIFVFLKGQSHLFQLVLPEEEEIILT